MRINALKYSGTGQQLVFNFRNANTWGHTLHEAVFAEACNADIVLTLVI